MEFKIRERKVIVKTNIEGKVLEEKKVYFVYRSLFFGLIKLYVVLQDPRNWKRNKEVGVEYMIFEASVFTKEEAEELIKAFKEQPDRFVRL